jgi:hypothetical protein
MAMGMSFGETGKSLFAGHLFPDFLSSRASNEFYART